MRSFWMGRSVFLTGHTGFKGSWLSLWLQQLGASVTGYALPPPTQPSLFELANVEANMTSIIGDIRDFDSLSAAVSQSAPEIIIHMAAQPLVRHSYVEPVETYSTNVMGTVHLLEAVRQCSTVRAVVNVTTDKCYENKEWAWPYRETDPLGGADPYSNSKACSELVTSAYRNSFFKPKDFNEHCVALATARAGNVIGGGDWAADRLIPDVLNALANGQQLVIRNPSAIRPWQHVLEPLRGYLILAQCLHENGTGFGESFNFGPASEDAKPVEWIVEKINGLWGGANSWRIDDAKHPHEACCLKLDISKALHRFGWNPLLSLPRSLEMTVDWCRRQREGEDARKLTIQQIDSYMNEIAQ